MTSIQSVREDKRLIAYTAAAMYGGGAVANGIVALIPGGPAVSLIPGVSSLLAAVLALAGGPRLPRWGLAALGPVGALLIAYAQATSPGIGQGGIAVLYIWPALWTAFFFGRRGAVTIVACIGVAHGIALLSLPAASRFPASWVEVMFSVSIVAVVVRVLVANNEKLLAQLIGEARTDKLTGLLNRHGFEEPAAIELAHARREQRSIAVITIDIDYFKRVNDEWGHETGDRVLARLGAVLTAHSREIDVVARVGGEEFVILLPSSDSADAHEYMQRVRCALVVRDSPGLPSVRVSAGIAAAVAPANVEELLERADSALYAAKRGGRDRVVIAEQEAIEPALALG